MIEGDTVKLNCRSVVMVFFVVLISAYMSVPCSHAEEKVIARVNGEPVTERQLEIAIDEFLPRAFFHGGVTPEKRKEFRPRAQEILIKKELYFQEAKKQGYVVSRAEIDEGVKKVEQRFKSRDEFQQALKASGFTLKAYESNLERNLLIAKFESREITEKARLTDAALAEYFEKHKGDFLKPESFRIRHILLKVDPAASQEERSKLKQEAEGVLEKARKGDDFWDLAYKYSQDDWRVKGGDLGLVHKGRLDSALEDAGFKLEKGQISDVVETIHGYHILKLEDKFPATQLSFAEVKDKLRGQLESSRKKDLEEQLLKRLKESAKIEIY